MVSVLRIQGQNKTTWTKIQGKIKDHGSEYRKLNFCDGAILTPERVYSSNKLIQIN